MIRISPIFKKLLQELGKEYTIKTIDLEECLYYDFGEGYDVEISEVTSRKKRIQMYLWDMNKRLIIKVSNNVPRTANRIKEVIEVFREYLKEYKNETESKA